jgi:dienelactone hydrolase
MCQPLFHGTKRRLIFGFCSFFVFGCSVHGKIVTEQIAVPVKVANAYGKEVEHSIQVTVFRDDTAPKPYPLLILNHGRAPQAPGRAAVKSAQYASAARWMTGFGLMVAVPIRVGYGETGGDDVEDSGSCERKNYPPVYRAAAVQTQTVLDTLRQRPDTLKDRAIVMGQSFGGATAIAVASLNPSGVQATINFAGGGGGNPETRPQDPCRPDALRTMFGDYGKTSRMPTLWIYSENDMYFGAKLPRQWFDAFIASGGVGEFALFPPVGDNGHLLFSRAPELWQPRVKDFLSPLGYQRARMDRQP